MVKVSSIISNKKKNALPSSKLLKPRKFKTSSKTPAEGTTHIGLNKNKLKLVKEEINEGLTSQYSDSVEFHNTSKKKSPKQKKSLKSVDSQNIRRSRNASMVVNDNANTDHCQKSKSSQRISTLFDFGKSQEKIKSEIKDEDEEKCSKSKLKPSNTKLEVQSTFKLKNRKTKLIDNIKPSLTVEDIKKGNNDRPKPGVGLDLEKCKLKVSKVTPITEGLLKLLNGSSKNSKPEILDVGEPIFLQVECIKIPICPTKQLRFKLPHPLADSSSDVLLITADLKGQKIYPEKAVEHYEEFLADLEINFINKVMPIRMIRKEYSQYEMRQKLVDQFDIILADSRILKSLPSVLGRAVMYKRKMPIPVNLTMKKLRLKKHLRDAVCKTQMTVKSNGHCSLVQVGHTKMSGSEVATNIVEVAKSLETMFPGGWKNIRCLTVKTAKSTSLPVYMSLLSPNEVKIPVEVSRRPQPVEDELSTMLGYNVVVAHDGNVMLKKVAEEANVDDSKDDEILEEAKKYMESSKTVKYDESSDEEKNEEKDGEDSEDEGDAITEAMERKLMNKYQNEKAKTKKNKMQDEDEEEEEDEEDEESEDESEIVPKAGKKRKPKVTKKQSGPPAKKVSSVAVAKGKSKQVDKQTDKKTVSPGVKKPQTRGTRAGKKTKLSKDQRKALIKRKKAGKK
ncbi:ribosomal L1 domain-containing protein 1-like [Macrosteles quadrilineatus]|uniref:ribosomal L1 domain-containing protein 1-like n=1 Tax=Macrosteles quadrilineatus TaxID=74068 RepID=UPI0023E22F95|nr:ribosomal L1 domain-containing protein 1-like [Macrosteles quadrilineatus]